MLINIKVQQSSPALKTNFCDPINLGEKGTLSVYLAKVPGVYENKMKRLFY